MDVAYRPRTRSGATAWGAGLRATAVLFLGAWIIHTADHLRRGPEVLTGEVMAAGAIAGLLQLGAIAAVLTNRSWAAHAAVAVGVPAALGIGAVHLLPAWGAFSDAFPGSQATGVTALSWFAATVEMASAAAFAIAGGVALRARRTAR